MDDSLPPPDLPGAVHSDRTHLQIPSRPEWIAPTVEYLKHRAALCGACHESRAGRLQLALHEALTNAVVHGNLEISSELKERADNAFATALATRSADVAYAGRTVIVDVNYDGDSCRWILTDEGNGFDFEKHLASEPDPESLLLSSGRGIWLMRAFLDGLDYDYGGRRAILTLKRGSGAEKRKHARLESYTTVQIAPVRPDGTVNWEAAYDGLARDVSAGGVGLLQSRLASTDRVLVGVEIDGRPVYIPAQVRHCRQAGEGVVELGCRFLLEPLSPSDKAGGDRASAEAAVTALLSQPRATLTEASQRAHRREAFTERIEIHDSTGTPAIVGFARDLSKGGIAFITSCQVPREHRVIVLPRGDGGSLRLRGQIVRCEEISEGFYDVAARFVGVE